MWDAWDLVESALVGWIRQHRFAALVAAAAALLLLAGLFRWVVRWRRSRAVYARFRCSKW